MAEFASTGVGNAGLATGIIGTALGVLNGGLGFLGNNGLMAKSYEQSYATMHDINDIKIIAEKDSEIARLNAKIYSDESDLALYKNIQSEINALRDAMNSKWTDQAVVNAVASNNIATLNNQVVTLQNNLGSITKTAVPTSAICNFGCSGSCSTI